MYLLHSKAVLTCISTEPPHVQVIHVHVPIKKCLQTFWSHDSPHRYYIHVNPLRHILSINRKSHLSQSLINPLRSAIWFTRQKPLSWQYIRCCWANWICKKHLQDEQKNYSFLKVIFKLNWLKDICQPCSQSPNLHVI